jgi:alpha-L-rhamnosidase
MAMLNFDLATFYAKAVHDLADAVRPNGGFTETAPFVGISDKGMGEGAGPVGWGTAHPLLLWQLYQYYGDQRLVEEQYDAAKQWVALLETRAQDGILDNGISDHESLVPKPRALTGTAFFYFNQQLLARLARIIGRQQEALQAEQKAERIKSAFNEHLLDRTSGRYDTGTQACQAFALYFGLIPPEAEANALSVLTTDIESRDGHLSTGIFGTKYLLQTLSDCGRADLAWTLVNQRTFPGWGHMIENGATTLWEHWAFSDNTFSHNHPMFGSVSEWFYKHVAGIQPAPDAVGFDKIIIRPQPVGDLKWVRAHYDSIRGRVTTHWEESGHEFTLRLSVPVGSSARVFLPAKGTKHVNESGRPLSESPGIEMRDEKEGGVELSVGSGDYEFTSNTGS